MNTPRSAQIRTVRIGFCAALLCLLAALVPGAARAAEPPLFAEFPPGGVPGQGAGMLDTGEEAGGMAASPVNHRLYVSDVRNRRISVFTAWGEFVKAFGWGVRDGASEFQTCTTDTGCQAGISGAGPGQFGVGVRKNITYEGPNGVAVDAFGDVYVMDLGNLRVQKFDAEGNFLLAFGGKVNLTTGGNVCTAASGDVCGAGQLGAGPGEFRIEFHGYDDGSEGLPVRDYLDVAPGGDVYVGDRDRIQVFNPDGSFKSSFALPEPGNPGALAVDPAGSNLYFAYANTIGFNASSRQPGVYRLKRSDGTQVGAVLPMENTAALAVDPSGQLYVASDPTSTPTPRVVEFDPAGNELGQFGELATTGFPKHVMLMLTTGVVGPGAGDVDIYASDYRSGFTSLIRAYGAIPNPITVGPPPKVSPEISEQFASSVDSDGAVVKARINPLFWNDTTYHVEYGTAPCSSGSCTSVPGGPGSKLTSRVTNAPTLSAGVFLGGLQPDTTYHYRFVAQSSGSDGQSVRGVGGKVGVDGAEGTFTTRPLTEPVEPCANDVFRLGAGALLPDCRGYEMVSPLDKNNADILTLTNPLELPARRIQSSLSGEKLTYSSFKAFGDAEGSPYSTQYLAERHAGEGWVGHSITPPRKGVSLLAVAGLDAQFSAFTPDLCSGWVLQDTALSLSPDAVPGFPNLYKADLCGSGGYEALTRVPPPNRPPDLYLFEVQGRSADGSHTVIRANDKLTANAPANELPKVYDYFEGGLRLVCVLPNKVAVSGCSAGTSEGAIPSGNTGAASFSNAVSADGQRIFWTAAATGPGKLYLRSNGVETTAISAGPAEFLGASPDGSKAIYREGKDLYEFEVGVNAPEAGTRIAGGLGERPGGVVGMSEDATRVYFVSGEDLDGGGLATAGQPNLYLYGGGAFTLVATLANDDVESPFNPVSIEPFRHAARVTADGEAVAFVSRNELTGQDSTDVNSGEADSQVYLWSAGDEVLRCVSCNRTGARPLGADANVHISQIKKPFWAAALLPTTESNLYSPRVLSDDGQRIFFESFDKLVSRDTNGTLDVYQWEADGKGSCEDPEGCIELISNGESPQRSEFVDADPQGENVFFTTGASLVGQDPGLIDVYDARIGGGFPPPPPPLPGCEGEACQGPTSPPNDRTPSSIGFKGPGNAGPKPRARRCPRGKRAVRRAGKARCVAKKSARAKRSKANNGRKGR